jgi:hypothetical protein
MTSLGGFTDGTNRPTAPVEQSSTVTQVEPLGGLPDMDVLMERFPPEVYQQGRDSRLYKFVSTLCGDAGVGQLAKLAYTTRLQAEGENLVFKELDSAYTQTFGFRRLPGELYTEDPSLALSPTQWSDLAGKDNAFRQRMQDFFAAIRFGNAPEGIELASRAGSGVDCEVVESYRAIFDKYSDDPLGLELTSTSVSHYEIRPHVTDASGDPDPNVTYSVNMNRRHEFTVDDSALDNTLPNPLDEAGAIVISSEIVWDTTTEQHYLKPELERNILHLVDRLRSVGTSMAVVAQQRRLTEHVIDNVFASSTRFYPSRFVTGLDSVVWPDPIEVRGAKPRNYWIIGGQEVEAPRLAGAAWERPTIFHTVEGVSAYTDEALLADDFNTADFWIDSFDRFQSVHIGAVDSTLASIYPLLAQVPVDVILSERLALAVPFAPLVLVSVGI